MPGLSTCAKQKLSAEINFLKVTVERMAKRRIFLINSESAMAKFCG
jgi:hypothetical protein